MNTSRVCFATKALTFVHELNYMCMNTSRYLPETFKHLRIIGRDMFFNQLCIMVSRKVTIRKFKMLYFQNKRGYGTGKSIYFYQ